MSMFRAEKPIMSLGRIVRHPFITRRRFIIWGITVAITADTGKGHIRIIFICAKPNK